MNFSFPSLMYVSGIIIGVAALIIVMGVMNGFDNELERKIVGITPHVLIENSSGVFPLNRALIEKIKNSKGRTFFFYSFSFSFSSIQSFTKSFILTAGRTL